MSEPTMNWVLSVSGISLSVTGSIRIEAETPFSLVPTKSRVSAGSSDTSVKNSVGTNFP